MSPYSSPLNEFIFTSAKQEFNLKPGLDCCINPDPGLTKPVFGKIMVIIFIRQEPRIDFKM